MTALSTECGGQADHVARSVLTHRTRSDGTALVDTSPMWISSLPPMFNFSRCHTAWHRRNCTRGTRIRVLVDTLAQYLKLTSYQSHRQKQYNLTVSIDLSTLSEIFPLTGISTFSS